MRHEEYTEYLGLKWLAEAGDRGRSLTALPARFYPRKMERKGFVWVGIIGSFVTLRAVITDRGRERLTELVKIHAADRDQGWPA